MENDANTQMLVIKIISWIFLPTELLVKNLPINLWLVTFLKTSGMPLKYYAFHCERILFGLIMNHVTLVASIYTESMWWTS